MPPTSIDKLAAVLEAKRRTSIAQAARTLGIGVGTLSRWVEDYDRGGEAALSPKRSGASGRPARFELAPDEADALRAHVLRRGSLPLAVEDFLDDPACGPETRAALASEFEAAARDRRKLRLPQSLRRAAYVSDELSATFRGPRAGADAGIVDRRGLHWIDADGQSQPMAPNVIWESDDMSSNEPYSYADPDTGAPRVSRQFLSTMDVYSAAWLGCTPVGRAKDAYRAEDILDHMLAVVDAHGLPIAWRLERGRWENNQINGIPMPDGSRWGGLDRLFHIERAFRSRGKGGIESGFNHVQNLGAHDSLSVGRVRGEFEAVNPVWRKAVQGDARAAARFWGIAKCADGVAMAMARFNARPKERRAFGKQTVVPDDLYRDFNKRDLPAAERWRFLPAKELGTVRGGHFTKKLEAYPLEFRFRVNGEIEGIHFPHGYPILAAFHPGRPEEGCWIFNAAQTTDTRNREAWPVGHCLGRVPMAADAPQFSMSAIPREQIAHRKRASAAVRTEFRAIVAGGRDARRHSVTRDSFGNRSEADNAPRTEEVSGATRRGGEVDLAAMQEQIGRLEARARAKGVLFVNP